MFIAGAIAALAGAAVSAYGAIQQGQQADQMGRYNAKLARLQAQGAQDAANADAEPKRRQYDPELAAKRARYGASGVTTEGSPLLVMLGSEEEAALDVARVQHGGAVAAQGLEAEAKLYRYQGAQARRASYLSATGSILSGVASAGGIYAQGGKKTPTTASTRTTPYGPVYTP
mgnify:FL=1